MSPDPLAVFLLTLAVIYFCWAIGGLIGTWLGAAPPGSVRYMMYETAAESLRATWAWIMAGLRR